MPTLPQLPQLNDAQYAYVVEVFTAYAEKHDLAGPAEAYVHWSMDNLVTLVRTHAYDKLQPQIDAARAAVDDMLDNLISGSASG